jgi:hypothetical protein
MPGNPRNFTRKALIGGVEMAFRTQEDVQASVKKPGE